MEPARYQRQIEIFHDLFAFKKLGMVYDDSPEGRVYAALEDVQKVAAEHGFTIASVFVKDKQNNREEKIRNLDDGGAANETHTWENYCNLNCTCNDCTWI